MNDLKPRAKKSAQRPHRGLTKRDLAILRFIQSDSPTAQEIKETFWPNAKNAQHHCHYRKLRALRSLGVIAFDFYRITESRHIRLTKKGQDQLGHF